MRVPGRTWTKEPVSPGEYGHVRVVKRCDHLAEGGEELLAGGVLVDPRAVAVAYGVPVDPLGGEERVVLVERLPEDVEGRDRVPSVYAAVAAAGQSGHAAQSAFAG